MTGITDFIALDVETANADLASICSIGLVHFKGGEIFKSLTILVDPEDDFDPINISIHGIRPDDVAGKPTMAKVFPIISAALQDAAIVHHSPFDRTALWRSAEKYGTDGLPCFWLDNLQVARRTWDRFKLAGGYGLANLAQAFSLEFRHHDAAEDARIAGQLLLKAVTDGGVTLQQWIDELGYASACSGIAPKRIKPPRNPKVAREGDGDGPLLGETVAFTGRLTIAREAAAAQAAVAGADVTDSVSKRTTILVVGDQDLRATKGQKKSTKHRRAEELIAKGCSIKIVGESDFLVMTAS
jgi:DNA polymerase-3 subunit epsilon